MAFSVKRIKQRDAFLTTVLLIITGGIAIYWAQRAQEENYSQNTESEATELSSIPDQDIVNLRISPFMEEYLITKGS